MNSINTERQLRGEVALTFARANLKEMKVDAEKWETEYLDEKTGEIWILDYPESELHGGGSPRLRKT
jgi:hypothetical protein